MGLGNVSLQFPKIGLSKALSPSASTPRHYSLLIDLARDRVSTGWVCMHFVVVSVGHRIGSLTVRLGALLIHSSVAGATILGQRTIKQASASCTVLCSERDRDSSVSTTNCHRARRALPLVECKAPRFIGGERTSLRAYVSYLL